jgi:hypothetical protein
LKKKQPGTSTRKPGNGKISSMQKFKLTNNSKVRFKKNHYNTFSLTQGAPEDGGTCPGMTEGAGGCGEKCYDKNLRKLYKAYAAVEDYNTSLVINKPARDVYEVIKNSVVYWLLGGGDTEPYFRIHTGGDFYNKEYVRCWAKVMNEYPSVKFWAYTRSLFAVPILAKVKNLTLYLSCDQVNKKKVLKEYGKYADYPNVAVAWMGNDLPEGFPQDRAYLICPEVTGKVKNIETRGSCSRCRACIDRTLKTGNIRHIQFPIHR